jgi:hypothetical protein
MLAKTTPDPLVDAPIEFRPWETRHNFGSVPIDSDSVWTLVVCNVGQRFGDMDSVSISQGPEVFTCELDSTIRLFPQDTIALPVAFHPLADTSYTGVLRIYYGAETVDDSLDIHLSGRGFTLDVSDDSDFILHPSSFILSASPNPFNTSARVDFSLDAEREITLAVWDLSGRLVCRLAQGRMRAGRHTAIWRAEEAASGIYICRLEADGRRDVKKLALVR